MKYQWWVILIYIFIFAIVFWKGTSGKARVTRSAVESLRIHNNYIIHFKENTTQKELQKFIADIVRKTNKKRKFNAEILQEFLPIKCLSVRLSNKALKWVIRHRSVMAVKENEYIILGSDSDSPTNSSAGWHLDKLSLPPVDRKSGFTGNNVDIYVLDSGINYVHDVFNGRAHYPGCDPMDKEENTHQAGRDCEGHGTHVAGLAGGKGTGPATGATLFSVRVLDCNLIATETTVMNGLMCVVNHRKLRNGTRAIINLSLAGTGTTEGINKALQAAIDNDIIITASAGNGKDQFSSINYSACSVYPAAYPGVINVGATDMHNNALMGEFDDTTQFTNMGKCVDVFAPGYKILSSDICPASITSCYNRACRTVRTGTSQSSGIVAGAVALLLEKCPKLTHTEIKNMLRHLLSVPEVDFFKKALTFLSVNPSLQHVIRVVIKTRRSLLNLRDLASVNCSIYHGQPLL